MKNREDDERSCPARGVWSRWALRSPLGRQTGSPVGKASGRTQPQNRGRGLNPTTVPQHPGGASELRSGGKKRVKHESCPWRLLQATTACSSRASRWGLPLCAPGGPLVTFPIASPLRCTRPPVNTGAATSPHAASDGRPSGAETHLGPGLASTAAAPGPRRLPLTAAPARRKGGGGREGRGLVAKSRLSPSAEAREEGARRKCRAPGAPQRRPPAPALAAAQKMAAKTQGGIRLSAVSGAGPRTGPWGNGVSLFPPLPSPGGVRSPLPTGGRAAWQPPGGSGGACARPAAVEGVRPLRGGGSCRAAAWTARCLSLSASGKRGLSGAACPLRGRGGG